MSRTKPTKPEEIERLLTAELGRVVHALAREAGSLRGTSACLRPSAAGGMARLGQAAARLGAAIARVREGRALPVDWDFLAVALRKGLPDCGKASKTICAKEGGTPPCQFSKTTSSRKTGSNSGLAERRHAGRLHLKPKGGAPRGNRNAVRTGRHTAEARGERARVTDLCRRARALERLVRLFVPVVAPFVTYRIETIIQDPIRPRVRVRRFRRRAGRMPVVPAVSRSGDDRCAGSSPAKRGRGTARSAVEGASARAQSDGRPRETLQSPRHPLAGCFRRPLSGDSRIPHARSQRDRFRVRTTIRPARRMAAADCELRKHRAFRKHRACTHRPLTPTLSPTAWGRGRMLC